MRRLLVIVFASLLGFSAPAFAQNATPVLIGQGTGQNVGQNGGAANGQDALAQDTGPGGLNPLLVAGGVLIGGGLIIYAATQNQNNPLSP